MNPKTRKILIWTLAIVLLAGLVWAIEELAGISNKTCADAGSGAAKSEMVNVSSVKEPAKAKAKTGKKPTKTYLAKIEQADADYLKILDTAKAEISSTGKVSDATRKSGLAAAKNFQQACEEYAVFWDKNKNASRANLMRETGASRVLSAEMSLNDIDKAKIEAYNKQQASVRKAQSEYMNEAKTDLSAEDRAALKAELGPKVQDITNNLNTLMQAVTGLLGKVKDQVASGGIAGAVGGCATTSGSGGSPAGNISALLAPLNALMDLVKSMLTNAQGLMTDLNGLS